MAYTNGYRYGIVPWSGGLLSREIQKPTYAATLELVTSTEDTSVDITLTGDLTMNATSVTGAFAFDIVTFQFSNDGSQRTVTFGTNFITNATVVVAASKYANISFSFSSAANKWVETGRFVQS